MPPRIHWSCFGTDPPITGYPIKGKGIFNLRISPSALQLSVPGHRDCKISGHSISFNNMCQTTALMKLLVHTSEIAKCSFVVPRYRQFLSNQVSLSRRGELSDVSRLFGEAKLFLRGHLSLAKQSPHVFSHDASTLMSSFRGSKFEGLPDSYLWLIDGRHSQFHGSKSLGPERCILRVSHGARMGLDPLKSMRRPAMEDRLFCFPIV
jgi:hypothetical protein